MGEPRALGGINLPPVESIVVGQDEAINPAYYLIREVISNPFTQADELIMPLIELVEPEAIKRRLSPKTGSIRESGETATLGNIL